MRVSEFSPTHGYSGLKKGPLEKQKSTYEHTHKTKPRTTPRRETNQVQPQWSLEKVSAENAELQCGKIGCSAVNHDRRKNGVRRPNEDTSQGTIIWKKTHQRKRESAKTFLLRDTRLAHESCLNEPRDPLGTSETIVKSCLFNHWHLVVKKILARTWQHEVLFETVHHHHDPRWTSLRQVQERAPATASQTPALDWKNLLQKPCGQRAQVTQFTLRKARTRRCGDHWSWSCKQPCARGRAGLCNCKRHLSRIFHDAIVAIFFLVL